MLRMDLEFNKGILFARLDGKLNRQTSYKINNYLVPAILKHKIKYLVFNLYKLSDIDESGLDALLNAKCAIKNNKGLIYLCETNKNLNKKMHKLHIKKVESEVSVCNIIEV